MKFNFSTSSALKRRILGGALWSIVGASSAKFIVLIASIVCANILGNAKFGELGIIRSTISMFVALGSLGLGITATKYIAEYKEKDKEKVSSIYYLSTSFAMVIGIVLSVSVILFSGYISDVVLKASYLNQEVCIGGILLFATIINGVQNGILSGFEKFKSIALNTLVSSCVEACFIIIGAYYWSVSGAVLGYGLGILTLSILNHISVKKAFMANEIDISLKKWNFKGASILYKFSIPAALSAFIVTPSYWIVKTLLVRFEGFSQLGIYEASDQWRIIVLFIPAALSQIVLPILANEIHQGKKGNYIEALKINLLINFSIALLLAICISIFSPFIMKAYGHGFNTNLPLILLAFSTVFSSIASVIGISIASRGKMWTGLCFNIIWGIMFVGFTYFSLVQGWGIVGMAASLLISYFLHFIFQSVYMLAYIKKQL